MASETDISIRTVTPKGAKRAILRAQKTKRPLFLWGPPGIGKSDIVAQIGEHLDAHVIDVRLSLWEPTDIKGIPYFDSNQNKMVWAPPSELPDAALASQHKNIILFLDEMNSAAPAVQAAAYQLILNRRVATFRTTSTSLLLVTAKATAALPIACRRRWPTASSTSRWSRPTTTGSSGLLTTASTPMSLVS
jgi:MoxR-like ATPase